MYRQAGELKGQSDQDADKKNTTVLHRAGVGSAIGIRTNADRAADPGAEVGSFQSSPRNITTTPAEDNYNDDNDYEEDEEEPVAMEDEEEPVAMEDEGSGAYHLQYGTDGMLSQINKEGPEQAIDKTWVKEALEGTDWVDQADAVFQAMFDAGIKTEANIRAASSDTLKDIGIFGLKRDVIKNKAAGGWRSERCVTGFVTAAAWDFDPTRPPASAVRSCETKHGFPFDNAYFAVWRGDKATHFLKESTTKGSAIFKSPPYSGKTAMMQCIAIIAARTQERKVFPLSFMTFDNYHETRKATMSLTQIFEEYWETESGYKFSDWNKRAAINGAVLLLDEIQVLYKYDLDKLFWAMLRTWEIKNVTVIAAAVYTISVVIDALSGHVVWGKEYFVGDLRLSPKEEEEICLRFNKFNKVGEGLLSLHTANWIRDNTAWHVGFTRELLDGLEDFAKTTGLDGDKAAARYLSSNKPFDALRSCRGYPPLAEWNGNMREACAILLAHAPVSGFDELSAILSSISDFKNKAIYPLLKLGVLTHVDASIIDFSSPVVHYLCARELASSSHLATITGIDSLVVEIVRRLQPTVLQRAFNFSLMRDQHLGESVWRYELLRAAFVCLGPTHAIMPEVGHIVCGQINSAGKEVEIPGLVDFFVNDQYSWALEVMREGYGISEHLGRFEPSGIYSNLVVKDYRVIDFRHYTKQPRTHNPHLLTVRYNDDFSEFFISGGALQGEQHVKCDLSMLSQGLARSSWWNVFPRWWN